MKTRRLFQAKDFEGNLHYIDDLNKKKIKEVDFFCPHCDGPVQPKMGEKKVWHFSHIDQPCEKMKLSSDPLSEDTANKTKDIWSFTKKFTVGSDFKLDSKSYQCEFCRVIQNKSYGIKWNEDIYICKECYTQLDSERLAHLQWKSML